MRKYILIGLGGTGGALLRYAIKNIHLNNYHGNIPLNTLFINVSGSFILALVLTIAFEVYEFDADIRLGIATGFLGAYTTFSTLCRETVGLLHKGLYFSATSYVAVSVTLGLAAVYFGMVMAREIVPGLLKRRHFKEEDRMETDPEVD